MHSGREQTVRDSRSYVAYWVIKCSLAFAVQTQWSFPWFISKSILPFSSVFMLTSQRADHAEPQHQMMINIATDTHLCIYLISMSVDSFWLITFTDIIFFFSLGNWRRKCLFPWQQQLKHQPLSVVRWWEFSSSRTQTLPCLHRGNVTQHVWSNDRGSQSAPFMGHSNRPVTESGIKWNMKILFFFLWFPGTKQKMPD